MSSAISTFHDAALIIFVRYPVPGKVKTRLAKTLGDERAAAFYRACAEYALRECIKLNGITRYLFYSESTEREKVMQWMDGGFLYGDQGPGDLGERMRRAFRMVFDRGARKAVIIGTDVPDISAALVTEAMQTLDDTEMVIGPSHDGGYYLLGMKRVHNEIFSGIEWGSENVFTQTVKRLESSRLSVHKLPKLTDIDNENDLRKWFASAPQAHPLKDVIRNLLEHG